MTTQTSPNAQTASIASVASVASIALPFADIPFVLLVLLPGLVPWWPGLAGPLLWTVAFAFTTVGRFGLGSSAATSAHI